MKCRICGNVGMLLQEVTGVELDVNRVYTKPVNSKRSETTIFGFCERCKHGQLDNVFNANHYDEYNLLFIDKNAGGGGNAPLREPYYRKVLEHLSAIGINKNAILDIGCGQGTIMEMASDYFSSVKGVEPSRVEVEIAREKGLEVAQTYFDRTWKEENYSAFITTQVLEHLPDPRETIETAYRILIPGGAGYIDVPNGYRIYQEGRYFDVFAEHINYWSVNSLTKLLSECGFCIVEAGEILNGDHIGVYVKKPRNHTTFEGRKRRDFEKAGDIFQRYRSVSVWGAGVKGREFIRTSLSDKPVAHLFDSNPTLNGRYVAGCAAPVETPSESGIRGSDAIILTAVEYKNEIISTLREKYGFKGVLIGIDEI